MKSVAIITENKYPGGDAGSIRQHIMAKMLTELGYDVLIHCMGETTNNQVRVNDGISYISYRSGKSSIIVRVLDRVMFVKRVLKRIRQSEVKLYAMLVIDTSPRGFHYIKKYANEKSIKLVHDSVEWYSPEEFPNGKWNYSYLLKNYTNTKAIDGDWNVIAISRFLEKHFKKTANKVTYIPVIMNMAEKNSHIEYKKTKKKRFVYAGAPGKKDYLALMISAFANIDREYLEKIEVHIFGVNEQQLIEVCGVDKYELQKLENAVFIHGRVPHEEAVEWVGSSDYTLLLRDSELRYAKAGFPTKIVESLKYGTPPICNLSSDLGDYLIDCENSIIIPSLDLSDIKKSITRAIDVPDDSYKEMRVRARKTGVESFDYHCYKVALESIFI